MTSVLLGRVTPANCNVTSGGNKKLPLLEVTPIEYLEALRELYEKEKQTIVQTPSSELMLSIDQNGKTFRFHFIMDGEVPSYPNIMTRLSNLAKEGLLNLYQGVAFPITEFYANQFCAELDVQLKGKEELSTIKVSRFANSYSKMELFGSYVPQSFTDQIKFIANVKAPRNRPGINRVNDKLTMMIVDINEKANSYCRIDDDLLMDPHMMFIRSRDLHFIQKAV